MASATIRLEGFKDLEAELAKLEKPATRKASARRALNKAAKPIADEAQRRAPRGETQRLAPSIAVGTKLSKRQSKLHRKMFRDDRAAVEMFVGAGPLPSSWTQEFGTRHNPPQPFLRPAWESQKMAALERVKVELWTDIQKSVARAERKAARLAAKAG